MSLSNGDVVEVYGTGNGLRARYPDPTSERPKVMADGAIGTVVGGPVTGDGYVRWKIQYDALPGIEAWSAEGEPSTGQMFLRKKQGAPTSVPLAPAWVQASAQSTNQIDISWTNQAANATGIRVYRSTAGSPYESVKTLGSSVTAWTDTNRAAGTTYNYRLRSFSAAGESQDSNIATAKTPPATGGVYSLLVDAVDLGASEILAVNVSSWAGSSSDFRTNTTSFTRTASSGTQLTVSAPASLSGGRYFQYWTLDSASRIYGATATASMTGNHAFIAVYGSTPPVTRTLSAMTIEGPSSVNERGSATYKAKATFSDGSSAYVNPKWEEDSTYTEISSGGVFDVDAIPFDKTVDLKATYTSGGNTEIGRKVVTIRNTDAAATYTLTRNDSIGGYIRYSPHAGSYAAGAEVALYAIPDSAYAFSHWSGDASGTNADTTVRMDRNRTVTANFVLDPSEGRLQVNILPPQAVSEGAQWKYRNYNDWRDSGTTQNNIPPGNGYVKFRDIPGWITPDNIQTNIAGAQTTTANATYREILGAVQVTLSPDQAGGAGARWRLDGGPWTESGVTKIDISPGSHTVEFLAIAGWSMPPAQTISVSRGFTTTASAGYTPPAGFPLITSISPRTGSIAGGTTVTIEGANFQAGAIVTFGGTQAASVNVVSPTRITAVTPSRATYGTVAFALTTGGQTITQANGFSYLNAIGSNMELVGQIGGNVDAVAVAGNLVYYSEGTSLVVADFTNSSAPVERGRIALPAFIRDIAVAGNIAYVAASGAGLYAVDIQSPQAPSIIGFYDTDGFAQGVTLDGTVAYVADADAGLLVLNVTNPQAISRLGALDTAGFAKRVAVGTFGAEKFAFVAENNSAVRVIRVTSSSLTEVASIAAQGSFGFADVKLVGTKLYASDNTDAGIRIFDVSTPTNPVQTASLSNLATDVSLDVVGTRLYACNGTLTVGNLSTGSTVARLGTFAAGSSCKKMVVVNNLAFGAMGSEGLRVVAVANPASMSLQSKMEGIGNVTDVTVRNGVAFTNGRGLNTVDVSNPARPIRLANLSGVDFTKGVVADGKATLVRYGNTTVRVINVANAASPTQVGTYTGVEGRGVSLLGNVPVLAAVTPDAARLPIVDVLNLASPSTPQRTGALILDSSIGGTDCIAVRGTWAFVGRSGKALDIVSLANPASPQKVGSIPVSLSFLSVAASEDGNHVYLAHGSAGVRVVDVSNKTTPVLGALIDPPQSASVGFNAVHVAGSRLYGNENGFVYVFDISNPGSPQVVSYYDTPGGGGGFDVVDDLLYVADSSAGVSILRLNDVDMPTLAITSPTLNAAHSTTTALLSLGGVATDAQGVTRVSWENDRGGGGVAAGTTGWQVPNITLAEGVNVITVTAEDANGNRATDSLTVTASFPDTTSPVVTIIGPKPDAEFATEAETVTISGSVADNREVAAVNWVDNHGHAGVATLNAQSWSIAGVPLEIGPNVITVTATDAAGNFATDVATILRTPLDIRAPSIAIAFPTPATEFATAQATLNVSGEANDDVGVKQIRWSNSRGGSGIATGTALWAVNGIALQAGLNSITLTVEDEAGKTSEDNLAVTYTPPDADGDGIADAWEMQFFGNLGAASSTTDTNGTGISDFLKFAFGIDPVRPNMRALPQLSVENEDGNSYLTLKYRQLMVPGNLEYRVGASDDLSVWDYSESQIEQIGLPIPTGDGLTEEVTVRLAIPIESLDAGFLRLKVIQTP